MVESLGGTSKLEKAYLKIEKYIHLLFLVPAACFWARFINHHLIWDEWLYVALADGVLKDPLTPLPSDYAWVPHPPLLWYLICLFRPMPRLAILTTSIICLIATSLIARRLHGPLAAKYAIAALLASWNYITFSLVVFTDMVVASFMAVSALAFLAWLERRGDELLFISSIAYSLASLSKYTAVPILLSTFALWLLARRRRLERAEIVKAISSLVLANIPLVLWIYYLMGITGGNLIGYYSSVYKYEGMAILEDLAFYACYTLLSIGMPLLLWLKNVKKLGSQEKLIIAYVLINLLFFSSLRTVFHLYQIYDRYLLPINPLAALMSGKLLAMEEKTSLKASVVFLMFIYLGFLLLSAHGTFTCAPTYGSVEEILRPPHQG